MNAIRFATLVRALVFLVAPLLAFSRASAGTDANMTLEGQFFIGIDQNTKIEAVGDFNGDGKTDLFRRRVDGSSLAKLTTFDGGAAVKQVYNLDVDPAYRIAGAGDFDGDGQSDLLLRRQDDTGPVIVWRMNEHVDGGVPQIFDGATVLGEAGAGWTVAGIADLNGDGISDILWWNPSTRGLATWLVGANPLPFLYWNAGLGTISAPWRPVAVGDLDGDGLADIVTEDGNGNVGAFFVGIAGTAYRTTGIYTRAWYWLTDGVTPLAGVAVADFDGDGKADLLYRSKGLLFIATFPSDGHTRGPVRYLGILDDYAQLVVGDFNTDRVDVWYRTSGFAFGGMWFERKFSPVEVSGLVEETQAATNWCWAATARTVMEHAARAGGFSGFYPAEQGDQAVNHADFTPEHTSIAAQGGFCGYSTFNPQGPRSEYCDQGSYPELDRYGFGASVKARGAPRTSVPLTLKELVTEFRRNRPVLFGWGWGADLQNNKRGHAMIAKGVFYDGNGEPWIRISDPAAGGKVTAVNFKYYGDGPASSASAPRTDAYQFSGAVNLEAHHHHEDRSHIWTDGPSHSPKW